METELPPGDLIKTRKLYTKLRSHLVRELLVCSDFNGFKLFFIPTSLNRDLNKGRLYS